MSAHPSSFEAYILRCADVLGIAPPPTEHGRAMFLVGNRWVELRHHGADDRVTFAALAYVAPPEESLRADLVASFNLRHLFEGGFSLVPGDEGFLYVCRPHQLACLDAGAIRQDLEAFARTAAMAGTWYLRNSEGTPDVTPAPSRDDGHLLRL
jgi:hypothetical protein